MPVLTRRATLTLLPLLPFAPLHAAPAMTLFEDFSPDAETRWTYVADGVMGGVSQGRATLADGAIRLMGEVSTANNGGFIQVRNRFGGGWHDDLKGLQVSARGNGQTYFIFLRIAGLARVWFSYRASFTATLDWSDTPLDFASFTPSHDGMPSGFTPSMVTSIGIVAYGRDHNADVSVRSLKLY